jgi:hypothetical protein
MGTIIEPLLLALNVLFLPGFFLPFAVHPLHLPKSMELRKKEGDIYSIG